MAIPCHTPAYAPLFGEESGLLVSSANSGHEGTMMAPKTYKTTPEQREKNRLKRRRWLQRHPEKAKEIQRKADAKRAVKQRESMRLRYQENRTQIRAQQKDYRDANKDSIRAGQAAYRNKKIASDPIFKIKTAHRARLADLMGGRIKSGSASAAWGCSDGELRVWIEGQFQSGWSWENYGKVWVVDHFFPLAWANLEDPAEFAAVWHHRNLRPLGKPENIAKGDSVCAQAQVLFSELVAGGCHV